MISRSLNPQSILRNIGNPGLLLEEIRGNTETDDADLMAIELVNTLLDRLNTGGILSNYLSSQNTLFNLQILNEEFEINRQDQTPISLTQRGQTVVGTSQQALPEIFNWRGRIPIYGVIPIIDLESQQIRAPLPISGNFFEPNLDLSDTINTPGGIRLFFIEKEFHKLWIMRESLAQLLDDGRLPLSTQDPITGSVLFTSNVDLNQYDFRSFDIVLDTLDHSEVLDPTRTFRNQTGQAAIIFDLLYRNYPGIVNTFQTECPFQIGQVGNQYFCPLGSTQGCGMKDRRLQNLQFPRDRIETNVYKFLRLLRDETVFKHEILYKITRLFPQLVFELNQYSDFWIGDITQDLSLRWIFRSRMPGGWNLPRLSEEKSYDLCLISPFCFEKGHKINFLSSLNNNEYIIRPRISLNPWILDNPFNQANSTTGNSVNCIIGRLSIEENLFNIKRRKRQLLQSIQFLNRNISQAGLMTRPNEILEGRLSNRHKRIGMATFGRYARYV